MTRGMVAFRGAGVLAVLLLWGFGASVQAQPIDHSARTLDVDEAPLGRALERAAAIAGIGLVYDYSLVRGRRATCSTSSKDAPVLLECLVDRHPIDFLQTSKGTYVLREAVRQPANRGGLTGYVRTRSEKRPLQNAHVQLPDAGEFVGTVTDSTGRYRLTGLRAGPHRVVVSHMGYETHEATVAIPANATARHDIVLAPTTIDGDALVVDAQGGANGDRRKPIAVPKRWAAPAVQISI